MIWIIQLLIFTFTCSHVLGTSLIGDREIIVPSTKSGFEFYKEAEIERAKRLYRSAFHFQPLDKWINAPNVPMMHLGLYHLFYSIYHNNKLLWAHSISTDLINWKSLPFPLKHPQNSDINGIWSGSATVLPGGRIAVLYTGIDHAQKQVLNLAFPKIPSDQMLGKWEKLPQNPLIEPDIENKINANSFRDPSTAWIGYDGEWRIIVGTEFKNYGLALLLKSKDFIKWTIEDHPFHFKNTNGMWEFPDFYPVSTDDRNGVDTSSVDIQSENVKYVLKLGLERVGKEYYTVGVYDKVKDLYVPDKESIEDESGLRYDYGKFYGSKTFFDSVNNRRILWGWVNESSPFEDYVHKGWHGVLNVPRVIWLDKSGKQLVQWPVEEINQLRTNQVVISDKVMENGSNVTINGITGIQADVDVSFKISSEVLQMAEVIRTGESAQHLCSVKGANVTGSIGPFGMKVLATQDMTEFTAVFFRIFKTDSYRYAVLMCSDQSRSSLDEKYDKTTYGAFVDIDPMTENLNLRILIDHSIIESFGGLGKSVITARVYPTKAIGSLAQLVAFNDGHESVTISKLNGWSMKKAEIK